MLAMFLTPFAHTPGERGHLAKLGPSLGVIRVLAVDPGKWRVAARDSGGPAQNCGQSIDSMGDSLFNPNHG